MSRLLIQKGKESTGNIEKVKNSEHRSNRTDNNILFLMYAGMDDRELDLARVEEVGLEGWVLKRGGSRVIGPFSSHRYRDADSKHGD